MLRANEGPDRQDPRFALQQSACELEGGDDRVELAGNRGADCRQRNDHSESNEGDDQSVLNQALSLFVAASVHESDKILNHNWPLSVRLSYIWSAHDHCEKNLTRSMSPKAVGSWPLPGVCGVCR